MEFRISAERFSISYLQICRRGVDVSRDLDDRYHRRASGFPFQQARIPRPVIPEDHFIVTHSPYLLYSRLLERLELQDRSHQLSNSIILTLPANLLSNKFGYASGRLSRVGVELVMFCRYGKSTFIGFRARRLEAICHSL